MPQAIPRDLDPTCNGIETGRLALVTSDHSLQQEVGLLLAKVAVFQTMRPEDLALLEAGSVVLEPRDGATVFEQGAEADTVYAVVGGDGHVRIGSIDSRSKALMVEVFRAGEIFGEIGVIDGRQRSASAVAEGRVRLVRIRGGAFRQALERSPELGQAMCQILARRLRRTFELLQDATFESLEVRLARQILYLIEREGRPTPQGVRLGHRLRQGDLADLLGATTRSIIRIMNTWRAEGMVFYDTERALLTVTDPAALRAIVTA